MKDQLDPGPAEAGPARPDGKFSDPERTLDGSPRAAVALERLETLWFNTGTLCNITCEGCYIESSPTNDRLAYLTLADLRAVLDEAERAGMAPEEIGFTGGEPFMNPAFCDLLAEALARAPRVLVLTNAMRPMQRPRVLDRLAPLIAEAGARLTFRVSLDHYRAERNDAIRGAGSFAAALEGLRWLAGRGAQLAVAARALWEDEDEPAMRAGFAALFAAEGLAIDAADPARLVIFPEMDESADVPEITTACWGILGRSPSEVMCARSRMVVRRRGADGPSVVACTLLPYDARFDLGPSIAAARGPVPLNHPHCARFCVLGGASCSA